MANLNASQRKFAIGAATLFLLAALGLGAMSMFYVGWIKYTVTTPTTASPAFLEGVKTRYIYNSRHRGLFFYMIDDPEAEIVKADNNNRYFPVVYNTNTTGGEVGFWTLTNMMKASVGLHVGYLATIALVIWMVVFSLCLGRKLIYLSAAILVLGLMGGGIGQVLFHIYVGMEKFSGIPELPDLWYYWPEELKENTQDSLYLSFGVHIGSFGASILALLTIAFLATSWGNDELAEERTASDKVNIYTRDNLAYDDTLMDKPARAELWNGFDRLSEKRTNSERRVRANYSRDDYAEAGHPHQHQHHHHHGSGGLDDRMERSGAPTRQHYHTDQGNFPIRY